MRSPWALPDEGSVPLEVDIEYAAAPHGRHAAELVVIGDVPGLQVRVPLAGAALLNEDCSPRLDSTELLFGLVRPSTSHRRSLTLTNDGDGRCDVWSLEVLGSSAFHIVEPPPVVVRLSPGESFTWEVEYRPNSPSMNHDEALLEVRTSPANSPPLEVRLDGLAPPVEIHGTPLALDFGEVPLGSPALLGAKLQLIGNERVEFMRTRTVGDAFRVLDFTPMSLRGRSPRTIAVAFEPDEEGFQEGELEIHVADFDEPIRIPLRGTGVAMPCIGACRLPRAVCPASQSAWVNSTIRLGGSALDDGSLQTCAFEVKAGPELAAAQLVPEGPCRASLRVDRPGLYSLEMTTIDDEGNRTACTTEIEALTMPEIFVETTWSGGNDIDLHLFHGGSSPADLENWFTHADCHFSNPMPSWDAPGTGDDPYFEGDDRNSRGPEQIHIDSPAVGSTYGVAVHRFEAVHEHDPMTATVRIFCGGELVTEQVEALDSPTHAVFVGSLLFDGPEECTFTPDGSHFFVDY